MERMTPTQPWEPTEIITAERAGIRACLFTDSDGTYSYEVQRRDTGPVAGSRYLDRWMNTGLIAGSHRITDWSEALVRAGNSLAFVIEAEAQRKEA